MLRAPPGGTLLVMSEGTTRPRSMVRPGDREYDDLRRVWNATVDRRPALIARCQGARDVASALVAAQEARLPVSVRGGGHSVAGHAVCDDGVMIDLRPLNGIEVDPITRVCRAGAGLLHPRRRPGPCARRVRDQRVRPPAGAQGPLRPEQRPASQPERDPERRDGRQRAERTTSTSRLDHRRRHQ
jgi:hypothetical protein